MWLVQFSPSKFFSQHTKNHGNEFRAVTKGEMIWAGGLKQKRNLLRNRAAKSTGGAGRNKTLQSAVSFLDS